MNAIVDRSKMEISGNEDHPLNVVRVNKVPQRIPLRLICSPAFMKLCRRINDYGGKDDFPPSSRCQQTVF